MYDRKVQDNGRKAWHVDSDIDRTVPYKKFEKTLKGNWFCNDIDSIVWKHKNGVAVPVAILELTSTDFDTVAHVNYLKAIEKRIFETDKQAEAVKYMGEKLGCPCYWVLFPPTCDWLYVLSLRRREWRLFDHKKFEEFMLNL